MTKLRKIALVFAVIAMVLAVFTGCAKKAEPAAEAEPAPKAETAKVEEKKPEKVELKVLNYLDMAQANSANEVTLVWDKFAEEYPNIIIEREDLFNEPFHQKTESYIASGNLPDVMFMWPSGRSTSLFEADAVQDLTPWLKRDGLYESYSPAVLVPQGKGIIGELANGLTSSHMFYVNKSVLAKYNLDMPKTLQDLIDMVPVLAKDNVQVIAMDNMDSWVMQSCLFSAIVGRYGGADWPEKIASGEWKFTDDWFMNALNVIDTLYKEGVISRASLNSPYGSSKGDFVNDKAAFYVDGDWATGGFMEDITTGKALLSRDRQASDFELTVFPAVPNEILHNTTSGVVGTGFGMSADLKMGTPEAEAAWTLIKFLQGEYVQKYRLSTGASFPSNLSIDVDAYVEEQNLEPFIAKRAAFYTAVGGTTPICDAALQAEVHGVINTGLQEIGLGAKTPAQVAEEVQVAYDNWKAMQM